MKTIAIAIVICTSMMSFAIPGRAAETLTLFPDRLIQRRGDNGGQALSALKEQDQQGTADDWDSYLELIPDRARYRGDFIFTLPQDVRIADLTSISLLTNYRGAQIQEQRWQWRIRDFAQRRWLSVGDNASAGDWEWTPMQFAITRPPADLVNARRKLRVRYQSAQPLDSSELDYLALQLKLRSDPGRDDWWRPEPSTSWQWQLSGQIDTTRDVAMYDLDLFETPEQTIDDLKAQGRTVVCYFSAGTWEPYRPDSDQFPERLLGRTLPDWPDEKWLDIRKLKTLAPIMEARLDLAVAKGCDGVEPDLVDAYSNDSGFPISAADQLRYNRWLAAQAHARGLSVGLKNDLEQVAQLVDVFDWALNEQCFQYQECDLLLPFIEQGKAVFGVEYSDQPGALDPADYCPRANAMGFSWLVKTFDLDASGQACWSYSDTDWQPPRSAADWAARPVRGAVIEIGYGGPDEYRDPPYPTVESLRRLRALGVRVVALEFQFTWRILPPYRPDRARIELLRNALDNLAEAGLYAVLAVRNGPGRNAMMPDVRDKDVITTFYEDRSARQAYRAMLQDLVRRFRDRPEIIAWEPMVEPAPDFYLTHESEPPYHRATALWKTLAPELIDAIRALDPERPILMEPVNWGGPGAFAAFEPFDDPNIVYSLHSYEPYAYTHQLEPPYRAYPGEFEGEVFDRAALDKLLSPVDDFQARYRVPVVVGEWGGIRWLPGMARYVADQISLFEARGWSWLWYAWDDEEWDERGFELHRGPVRETTGYDPQAPAFAPLLNAWAKNSTSPDALATFPYALETRADGALRLTDPPGGASDQNPAFSPDGRFMIFTRFDNGYNRGPSGLYRIDLSSGETVRLTPPEDQDNVNLPGGSWNRVKKRIVFASDRRGSNDLWRIAPDGRRLRRITRHRGLPWYTEPSWSPDGKWIVFEAAAGEGEANHAGSIWKVRANGRGLKPLTHGPAAGWDDRQPNWSPDGERILFQRRATGSDDWNIFTLSPEGRELRQVTMAASSDTDASWSPDGRSIVYSSDFGGLPAANIHVIPALGGAAQPVTASATREDGAPAWSPDGRWIVFESHPVADERSPAALWVVPAPVPGAARPGPRVADSTTGDGSVQAGER